MHIGLLDMRLPKRPQKKVSEGQLSLDHIGESPDDIPSAPLLARAAEEIEAGQQVSYHAVAVDETLKVKTALGEDLDQYDRVVICHPRFLKQAAQQVGQQLATQEDKIELFDPWSQPASNTLPAYQTLTGQVTGQVDTGLLPIPDPVHPWTCPALTFGPAEDSPAILKAAAASLAGNFEADLCVTDDRVPVDMDRLRFFVQLIQENLEQHKTLLRLHLRAWPADLLDASMMDHMTLLSVASLDVLVGSLHQPSLSTMGNKTNADQVDQCIAELKRSGMAHVATLSVVLGLPEETPDHCVENIETLFKLLNKNRIRRVRFSFWLDGQVPADAEEQQRLFLANNPAWSPIEYQGIQDYLAIIGHANPHIKLVGPHLLRQWAAAEGT